MSVVNAHRNGAVAEHSRHIYNVIGLRLRRISTPRTGWEKEKGQVFINGCECLVWSGTDFLFHSHDLINFSRVFFLFIVIRWEISHWLCVLRCVAGWQFGYLNEIRSDRMRISFRLNERSMSVCVSHSQLWSNCRAGHIYNRQFTLRLSNLRINDDDGDVETTNRSFNPKTIRWNRDLFCVLFSSVERNCVLNFQVIFHLFRSYCFHIFRFLWIVWFHRERFFISTHRKKSDFSLFDVLFCSLVFPLFFLSSWCNFSFTYALGWRKQCCSFLFVLAFDTELG